jgi:hypothetical protein
MINPQSNTTITSSIIDGDDYPRFCLVADDQPDKKYKASLPSGVWLFVHRKTKEIRNEDEEDNKKYTVNGAHLYDLADAKIVKMIQDLPGANKEVEAVVDYYRLIIVCSAY